jgi:Uma2 family endonuclease
MATQTIPRLTEEEYLELDRANDFRSEFIDGEMLAMSGGTGRHSALSVDLTYILKLKLVGRGCTVFNTDMRIRVSAKGAYLYPDASVACGEVLFDQDKTDVFINPVLIGEVLSPSTEDFDKGKKFDLYRSLDSLKEYLLVHTTTQSIAHYSRQPDNSWLLREAGPGGKLLIPALSIELGIDELYADSWHLPL